MPSWVTTGNGPFLDSAARSPYPCSPFSPGVNTTAPLAPLFRRYIRQDNTPKRRPPDPLNNLVSKTFGPTTPETAREIPWAVTQTLHAMTTSTNTRVQAITRITVLIRDHRHRIQPHARIRFRAHSCNERRVIAHPGLALLHSPPILGQILGRMVFGIQVPRPGWHRLVREGIPFQPMVVRRETMLQQRVGYCVHSGHPALSVSSCSLLRLRVIRNGHRKPGCMYA